MKAFFKGLVRDERGISALEYAVLAGVIIAAVVIGANIFGDGIVSLFTDSVPESPTYTPRPATN